MLSLDEEAKLLDALHPRFQRFARFALGTGARLDEIRGIDPDRNINWQDGTVHVLGKFRKERDIPMQPDARAALEEQLDAEGKLWKQNPQRLREVLAQGTVRAKIPHLTPHTLRHTFGTRWLQAGGDIYKLSKILGHASVAVTEAHYVHLLKEDLVAASRQVRLPIANRRESNVVPIGKRRASCADDPLMGENAGSAVRQYAGVMNLATVDGPDLRPFDGHDGSCRFAVNNDQSHSVITIRLLGKDNGNQGATSVRARLPESVTLVTQVKSKPMERHRSGENDDPRSRSLRPIIQRRIQEPARCRGHGRLASRRSPAAVVRQATPLLPSAPHQTCG